MQPANPAVTNSLSNLDDPPFQSLTQRLARLETNHIFYVVPVDDNMHGKFDLRLLAKGFPAVPVNEATRTMSRPGV
jgi:hypothetical protein